MDYSKLEKLRKEKKVTLDDLAVSVGMTRPGFSKMLQNKTCTVEVLEKLSAYFGLPITWFFNEDEIKTAEPKGVYINEKDRIIADLRLANDLLKEKLDECCGDKKAFK